MSFSPIDRVYNCFVSIIMYNLNVLVSWFFQKHISLVCKRVVFDAFAYLYFRLYYRANYKYKRAEKAGNRIDSKPLQMVLWMCKIV